jgi:succinate dehydrogenase / fumarate reductase, cytochrome b subunit
MQSSTHVSTEFIWRRVHSLMGLWLVLYLIEHLLVNSQAALWFGDHGIRFVQMVNSLESLPFLYVIEIVFLGVPFAIHMVWGVHRALQAKTNAATLRYSRNYAFTWQRITSWVLLIGIIFHVAQMRFLNAPKETVIDGKTVYFITLKQDEALSTLASQIHVTLSPDRDGFVCAYGDTPGAPMLLMVRETFKNPWMVALYSIFLVAASFHAFNGVWTSLITWGVILSYRSQKALIPASVIGMGLLMFLGFAAILGG